MTGSSGRSSHRRTGWDAPLRPRIAPSGVTGCPLPAFAGTGFAGMTPENCFSWRPWDQVRGGLFRDQALKRSQRPFLGDLGLSCTDCQEQALRRGSVGADALLKLPGRPEPPGGSRVLQHCAKRSLLAPLADRSPIHSHPPIDGSADDKQRRFSSHAAICPATLTFGNARSNQCHAPRRLVRR
jgi:hypothetical protein